MTDKYGRTITHVEIDGRHRYSIAGKITITLDSEDEALAKCEEFPPDASDYSSVQCDFEKYRDVFKKDFEGSTYGEQLKAAFIDTLETAKTAMTQLIFANYNARMEEVFNFYPKHEPATWPIQKNQAMAWISLSSAAKDAVIADYGNPENQYTLLLSVANKLSGSLSRSTVDELVGKISQNGYIFEVHCGELTGYVSRLRVMLAQASTVQEFLDLDIEFSEIQTLAERFA